MNDQSISQNFDNRLKKLERQNRLMKYSLLILLSIATFAALTGTNAIKEKNIITAQGFVLIDSLGNRLAQLGYDNPKKDLYRTYFIIFMDDDTPGINIVSSRNKENRGNIIAIDKPFSNSGILLATSTTTLPLLTMGHNGADFFSVSANDDIGVDLSLSQLSKTDISGLSSSENSAISSQLVRYKLRIDLDGSTNMIICDNDLNPKIICNSDPYIGLIGKDESSITLNNSNSEPYIGLRGNDKSSLSLKATKINILGTNSMSSVTPTGFKLSTSTGNRAVLGQVDLETTATGGKSTTPLSALTLFDKAGKVIWKAP